MPDAAHYERLLRNLKATGRRSEYDRWRRNETIRKQKARLREKDEEIAGLIKTIKEMESEHRTEIGRMAQAHGTEIGNLIAGHEHSINTARRRQAQMDRLRRVRAEQRRSIVGGGSTRRRRRRRSRR